MLRSSFGRLLVIHRHLTQEGLSTLTRPRIIATPPRIMADEQVKIQLQGLQSEQIVTVVAHVVENKTRFESRGVYRANREGKVDMQVDASLDGTYTGVDGMGLIWSIHSGGGRGNGMRLVKKDVTSPMVYNLKLFNGVIEDTATVEGQHITEMTVDRCHMRDGVRRIPVKDGKLRGTIFIPEGDGPFPALMDMSGGLVSINETRASVLASHGFAVFTLTYLYVDHLPKNIMAAQPTYIADAARYFLQKPYVDEKRFGSIGVCLGGYQSLILASLVPQVRAVVNIGGVGLLASPMDMDTLSIPCLDTDNCIWPKVDRAYATEEGVVINDIYECPNPHIVPAWIHGAKLLFLWGEDDKQVHPKWFSYYKDNVPDQYKHCGQFYSYPETGHMIELPYTPHQRSTQTGRLKNDTIDFIPPAHKDKNVMSGGYPKPHAAAQVDAWEKILAFLNRELCT